MRVGNDTSHPERADNFEEIEACSGCKPPQKSGFATFLFYTWLRSRSQLGRILALMLDTMPMDANRVMMEEPP